MRESGLIQNQTFHVMWENIWKITSIRILVLNTHKVFLFYIFKKNVGALESSWEMFAEVKGY